MKNKEVYQAIKKIAGDLCKENKTYLRADLAYELKPFGVDEDSSEVSRYVYDAYQYYNNDGNIAIAFVTNNGRSTVVNDYRLNHLVDAGETDKAMTVAQTELSLSLTAINKLSKEVETVLGVSVAKGASGVIDFVTGTKGVKNVRAKASALFDRYAKLVDSYHYAEDSVKGNIADFATLRSDIEATYQEYSMRLIDIYGDSIKMVSPDVFDFSKIEWLDVDRMLKNTELEYNRITDKCAVLIGEISDSFRASVQDSLTTYKSLSSSGKGLGLAMAGLQMLNHYMGSGERTNRMKADLAVFQASVKRDTTLIKADIARLLVIYKCLNDVIIPKADIFMRHCSKLMDSDIKAITDMLYSSPEIRPLEEERRRLLRKQKELAEEINDHLQNINTYNVLITDTSASLESKRPSYQDAKDKKPSKPFFLINILTFGSAGKKYNRAIYEWDEMCAPMIKEYEALEVDLKLDQDELSNHKAGLAEAKKEYKVTAAKLNKVSANIRKGLDCSDEVKKNMLKHIRTIVGMLRLGREIVESKIDKKLLHTVDIPDYSRTMRLPDDVEQNLSLFTGVLSDNLHVSPETVYNLIGKIDDAIGNGNAHIEGENTEDMPAKPQYSPEEIAMATDTVNDSLQSGITLFDSFAQLQNARTNRNLAAAAYDKEYDRLTEEFRSYMNKVDDKSAYLREVMKRVNLADNEDDRKQAMLMLSELSGISVSEDDFNEFIKGDKTIEL